ncbi:DarT ssDNA thymidine ADP-ribosyltransferase family protein [Nonomuraea sp. C10]|uniref:DarT ssDNA thymidine ADP-ribosyltransferase family protein n=1 Tax=Nonomuraea sp. C10 TaxID=2600577 RepID=UPI0011CE2D54|nr:DUF4433 domain-containing protein [Nonomuraea sp. C10]
MPRPNLSWFGLHVTRGSPTDRNAAVATARFTAQAKELPTHIDWEIMAAQYWANTAEDGFRMQRRMAELLVHGASPRGVDTLSTG